MKDEKAVKHLQKLGKYCDSKTTCRKCVFQGICCQGPGCQIGRAIVLTRKKGIIE